eukprot:scaffold234952_cov16-Prasinocladus_malaysianus.AAC.1
MTTCLTHPYALGAHHAQKHKSPWLDECHGLMIKQCINWSCYISFVCLFVVWLQRAGRPGRAVSSARGLDRGRPEVCRTWGPCLCTRVSSSQQVCALSHSGQRYFINASHNK